MRRRPVLALMLGLALAGCAPQREFEPQPLLYADRPEIRFAVERVEVVDRSGPARTPFEESLDVPPALAAMALLRSRLTAVGGTGIVRAVITEASVEREELEARSGLAGVFVRDPEAALSGRLGVRVEVLAPDGAQVAAVASTASLRRTVPARAFPEEERRIAFELVRDLVDQLDAGLEANIRENLARYLAAPGA